MNFKNYKNIRISRIEQEIKKRGYCFYGELAVCTYLRVLSSFEDVKRQLLRNLKRTSSKKKRYYIDTETRVYKRELSELKRCRDAV